MKRHFLNMTRSFVLVVTALLPTQLINAQVQEFVPFHRFLEHTKTATSETVRHPGSRVKDAAAFEEMRQRILKMYQDVEVVHSFELGSSHFDCVPILDQPGVRLAGLKSIAPKPPRLPLAGRATGNGVVSLQEPAKTSDEFGNSLGCEEGTIPMRRITLEEMTQFSTLRDYFQKGPDGLGRALPLDHPAYAPAADPTKNHRYAQMGQLVNNLGGSSTLNIWTPYVDTAIGEVFSLSQEWYIGGTGPSLQTVEVGWHNFPAHYYGSPYYDRNSYVNQHSRLFIYYTADNYQTTGCYNVEPCSPFMQVDNTIPLGQELSSSTPGGTQYELSAKYLLYQGNWWLAINGTWIGFYPGSIFRGGQLTKYATGISFGTESVSLGTVWPREGSGNWSQMGYGQAAYQKNLYYFDTFGTPKWDYLQNWGQSQGCYNLSWTGFSNTSGMWFYAGGPGGWWCP